MSSSITQKTVAVVGLGYVGLPLALAFGKKMKTIGFDISESKLAAYREGIDPTGEMEAERFKQAKKIVYTSQASDLYKADFIIVAVPTPIDHAKQPDLTPVIKATQTLAPNAKAGVIIIYESTVYPGVTDDVCGPLIEKLTGKKRGVDFKLGYSPERINPGDKEHRLENITKIVSGEDAETLEAVAALYSVVVEVGVYKASSIKVAEAAKVIENTQRDVNIALINELAVIFNLMNIDTLEVLEAAGTKWNFLPFRPGLVGGHCIGVDPYYLTYKAQEVGYHAQVINSGRYVNDSMGFYVAKQTVKKLIAMGKDISKSRVLVMGATFKEDVEDIRNSKVVDVINEFKSYGVNVDVIDPRANSEELKHEYGFELVPEVGSNYDAIVVAVNHKEYKSFTEADFKKLAAEKAILVDLKGILRGKIKDLTYWSL